MVSPTGSGKTLSAILPAVDDVLTGRSSRGATSILYISPMKALGADLMRTLEGLSEGLGRIPGKKIRKRGARKKNSVLPDAFFDVGIRTGDVPQSVRRRMLVDPPDLLVVTPENLLLMSCSKARETLSKVRFIIIDEVHEMVGSKRGALLSLTIEYLSSRVKELSGWEPLRIGLSATIRPESLALGYIGGADEAGRLRDVVIVKEEGRKDLEIEIRTLFNGIEKDEEINEKLLNEIGDNISEHEGSMVVFHNTRKQAEEMAYALNGRGLAAVMPHHGSLGPDVRKEAEEGLKEGQLKAIISSTSLELGIDIGTVSQVIQVSSPKDPGKLLQRLGRSGHGLGRTSKGILYPRDPMDLLECLSVSRAATLGELEKKLPQDEPMDVLAQFVTGLMINENNWSIDDIWRLSKMSYPFRKLRKGDLDSLLKLLTLRLPGPNQPPPRLWMSDEGILHTRRNTKQAFYLNCGTIPKETTFKVMEDRKRRIIGNLSRDFGEALYERDVILLGSRSYRVTGFSGSTIHVREDQDAQPTVPRWTGEVNPRPLSISRTIMRVMEGSTPIENIDGQAGARTTIDDQGCAALEKLKDHMDKEGILPQNGSIPVETISKGKERRYYIFHIPLGRKVTEPMGRVLSYGIRKKLGALVDYIATDDGFAISSPTELSREQLIEGFGGDEFGSMAKELVLSSSMFRTRFSQILAKSLIVLSRFRGKETGVLYRRNRVSTLLKLLLDQYYSQEGWNGCHGPMTGLVILGKEALSEVYREKIDIDTAMSLVKDMMSGESDLIIGEPKKAPSIPGRSIVATWESLTKKRKRKPLKASAEVTETRRMDLPGETRSSNELKERFLRSIEEPVSTKYGLYRDFSVVPLRVTNEEGRDLGSFPLTGSEIARRRTYACSRSSRSGSVLSALPFFSHPMDILSRASNSDIVSVRSMLMSRRIVPCKIAGEFRLADPGRERLYQVLSPRFNELDQAIRDLLIAGGSVSRTDLGDISKLSGNDLSELVISLQECRAISSFPEEARYHLGADKGHIATGYDPVEKFDQKDIIEAVEELLESFGPMALEELNFLLDWPLGHVPSAMIEGIEKGLFEISTGPEPLIHDTRRKEPLEGSPIWIWSRPSLETNFEGIGNDGTISHGPFHHKDPVLVLTGKDPRWVEKEKIRMSLTANFIFRSIEEERASWSVVERCDQVLVRGIEVEEFSNLKGLMEMILETIDIYEKMGYHTIKIEKIMGVPAGEAAERALSVMLSSGFIVEDTAKGKILIRTDVDIGGFPESDLLPIMLTQQCLTPGSHVDHPLQVLEKLGSIIDRWELLSRIGSKRNSKFTDPDMGRIERMFRERASSFVERVTNGGEIFQIEWDGLLSRGMEDLSDLKDLSKRFNFYKGILDQPTMVWSLKQEFERYPGISSSNEVQLTDIAHSLLQKRKELTDEEWNNHIKVHGLSSIASELISKGILIEDPWGHITMIEKRWHGRRKRHHARGTLKGVLQRAWVLRCSEALGAFRMEDLMEYSPELADITKVRYLLNDLSKGRLRSSISLLGQGDVVYHIDPERMAIKNIKGKLKGLTVISPRDRMWSVLSSYMRGAFSRGSGFSIFDGDRPVAYLTMRKMARGPKNLNEDGSSFSRKTGENWLIKKAWLDPRLPRSQLMRSIRKRFFEFGIQVLTEDEKTKIEDLYRDMDSRDETNE